MIIDSYERIKDVYDFLNNNIIYKFGDIKKGDESYFEICSIKEGNLLISDRMLDDHIFVITMQRFIESRKMLLDQDYKGIYNYNLSTTHGGSSIIVDHGRAYITLYTSISDSELLVPVEREFLMSLLNLIDNGRDPVITSRDNEFYLSFGNILTIKFDRVLLKYIEEYTVNCKHNREYNKRLERKK